MAKQRAQLGASYSQPTLADLFGGADFDTIVKGKNYLVISQPQPSDNAFVLKEYGLFRCGATTYDKQYAAQDTETNVFSDQDTATGVSYASFQSDLKAYGMNAKVYLIDDAGADEVETYLGF